MTGDWTELLSYAFHDCAVVFLTKHFSTAQVKEDNMGETFGMYEGEKRCSVLMG